MTVHGNDHGKDETQESATPSSGDVPFVIPVPLMPMGDPRILGQTLARSAKGGTVSVQRVYRRAENKIAVALAAREAMRVHRAGKPISFEPSRYPSTQTVYSRPSEAGHA